MIPALKILGAPLAAVANGVVKHLGKKEERRKLVADFQGKVELAKESGAVAVKMTAAQLDLVRVQLQGGTWKDEFITIIVMAPFITNLLGAVLAAFGWPEVLEASNQMFLNIKEMGIDYGNIVMLTVAAALGLRAIR